jgi:hypothetical protein
MDPTDPDPDANPDPQHWLVPVGTPKTTYPLERISPSGMVVTRRPIFSSWPCLLHCTERGVLHLLVQLIVPHLRVLEHLLHGVHRAEGEAGRLQVVSDGMKFFTTRDHLPGDLAHLSSKNILKITVLRNREVYPGS